MFKVRSRNLCKNVLGKSIKSKRKAKQNSKNTIYKKVDLVIEKIAQSSIFKIWILMNSLCKYCIYVNVNYALYHLSSSHTEYSMI